MDHLRLPSFCTSSQMGGRDPLRRPETPPLSPLLPHPAVGAPGVNESFYDINMPVSNNQESTDQIRVEHAMNQRNIDI